MARIARVGVLVVLLGAGPLPATRYVNPRYGVSFAIPAGADVCRSPPPLPDHGLLFRPPGVTSPPCDDDIEDGARYTSFDAHFDVDRSVTRATFVPIECPQIAYDSRGTVTPIASPGRPGGLAWVGCRIAGVDGSVREIWFAQRRGHAGVPTIDYTIALKTTGRAYPRDRADFVLWLATLRFQPPRG